MQQYFKKLCLCFVNICIFVFAIPFTAQMDFSNFVTKEDQDGMKTRQLGSHVILEPTMTPGRLNTSQIAQTFGNVTQQGNHKEQPPIPTRPTVSNTGHGFGNLAQPGSIRVRPPIPNRKHVPNTGHGPGEFAIQGDQNKTFAIPNSSSLKNDCQGVNLNKQEGIIRIRPPPIPNRVHVPHSGQQLGTSGKQIKLGQAEPSQMPDRLNVPHSGQELGPSGKQMKLSQAEPAQMPDLVNIPHTSQETVNQMEAELPALPVRAPKPYSRGTEFEYKEADYNVAEFYEQFQNNLPQTIFITEGFCGEIIEDIFDRGQVLRIHAVSSQKRVIANFQYSSHTMLISIPETYSEKLCIVKSNKKRGKPKPVYTILKECTLPITAQFPKDQKITVGSQTVSTNNIPSLELIKSFDEVYLLGNCITNGEMNLDVIPVPLYLQRLRVSIVTGIKGQSEEEWNAYQQTLDREASIIEFDLEYGNPNIAEYDPTAVHSEGIYTYVEPRNYSNIVSLVRNTPRPPSHNYEDIHPELHIYEDGNDLYDEIENTARDGKNRKEKKDDGQRSKGQQKYTKELENVTITKEDIEKEKQSERKRSESLQNVKKGLDTVTPLLVDTTQDQENDRNRSKSLQDFKDKLETSIKSPNIVDTSAQLFKSIKPVMSEVKRQPPPTPGPPPVPAGIIPKPPSSASRPLTGNLAAPLVPEKRPIRTQHRPNNVQTHSPYSNILPSSRISPTVHAAQDIKIEKTSEVEMESCNDVTKLTIDEVSDYMKKLKLEKYVENFRAQLIDGRMLIGLDKEMLREEFDMKGIEALRLINFAKDGHIPK